MKLFPRYKRWVMRLHYRQLILLLVFATLFLLLLIMQASTSSMNHDDSYMSLIMAPQSSSDHDNSDNDMSIIITQQTSNEHDNSDISHVTTQQSIKDHLVTTLPQLESHDTGTYYYPKALQTVKLTELKYRAKLQELSSEQLESLNQRYYRNVSMHWGSSHGLLPLSKPLADPACARHFIQQPSEAAKGLRAQSGEIANRFLL